MSFTSTDFTRVYGPPMPTFLSLLYVMVTLQ